MAILDKRATLSAAQAITADAASTDYYNCGSDADVGVGTTLFLTVVVDVAADATTGDETYVYLLQTDDNSSFSSATDIVSITIPRGTAAGTVYTVGFPAANEKYFRGYADVGGTTPTVTLTAYISPNPPTQWKAYADARSL